MFANTLLKYINIIDDFILFLPEVLKDSFMMMYHSSVMLDVSFNYIHFWLNFENMGISSTPDLLENWRTNVKF